MAKKTLYDVLQVSRNADPETIEAAYKSLVQRYHPDKNPDNPDAEKNLKILNRAYEVLSDPVKRAGYDAALAEDDEEQINQTAELASTGKWEKTSDSRSTSNSEPLSNRDLYATYLGEKNQDYYLNKFEEFDGLGDGLHISWNWPAFMTFLFGATWWALYRKLYGWFFALLFLGAVLYSLSNHIPITILAVAVLIATTIGMFANVIYYRRVKTKISAAKSVARSNDELIEFLRNKGGVHAWVWWILWVWLAVAVVGIIAAIAIPANSDSTKKAKAQAGGNVPQLSTETRKPPASTDKTGWVKLLCSGSSKNATVFQFSEEARLVRINGTEYVPDIMNEDNISVTNSFRIENYVYTTDYNLNRVNGELVIFFLGSPTGSYTQYCRLSETNKF